MIWYSMADQQQEHDEFQKSCSITRSFTYVYLILNTSPSLTIHSSINASCHLPAISSIRHTYIHIYILHQRLQKIPHVHFTLPLIFSSSNFIILILQLLQFNSVCTEGTKKNKGEGEEGKGRDDRG